jgi:hypothetical protein
MTLKNQKVGKMSKISKFLKDKYFLWRAGGSWEGLRVLKVLVSDPHQKTWTWIRFKGHLSA